MKRIQMASILILTLGACHGPAKEPVKEAVAKRNPQRYAMVTGLHAEKAAYYKELHANAWKGVLAKIHDCNIRNYSIYLKEIDGKQFLFSYYEYVGENYVEDMKKIAADTTTRRWWQETDPCQIPLPEAAAENKIWTEMEEVFHTD